MTHPNTQHIHNTLTILANQTNTPHTGPQLYNKINNGKLPTKTYTQLLQQLPTHLNNTPIVTLQDPDYINIPLFLNYITHTSTQHPKYEPAVTNLITTLIQHPHYHHYITTELQQHTTLQPTPEQLQQLLTAYTNNPHIPHHTKQEQLHTLHITYTLKKLPQHQTIITNHLKQQNNTNN